MNPPVKRRAAYYFLPAMGAAAALYGAFYMYIGARTLLDRNWGVGALTFIFGFCGIALGMALYRGWKSFG